MVVDEIWQLLFSNFFLWHAIEAQMLFSWLVGLEVEHVFFQIQVITLVFIFVDDKPIFIVCIQIIRIP